MKIKVRTTWGRGMVSVGSPVVFKALSKKEPLFIECNGAAMCIPYEELKMAKARSGIYLDKKTRKAYTLYDFVWKGIKK